MKISEMSNKQAKEALIRLSGPFAEICDDEEAVAIVDEYKERITKPTFYAMGQIIPALVKHLLVKHEYALNEIISVLTGWPVAKIDEMNFKETVQVVKDSYDEVLASFFRNDKKG